MENKKLTKIIELLKKYKKDKHTGEVVLRLQFNQGGVRDCKLIKEKQQSI